jgi:uncharacterized phage protein (TIGR01671 family)
MGREIKFKVWLTGDSDNLNFNSPRWINPNDYIFRKYNPWFPDKYDEGEFEILQYTGLKDLKGNEIYEGDIVRCWFNTRIEVENIGVIEYCSKYGHFGVRVTEANIHINAPECIKPFLNFIIYDGTLVVEVIGNKFDNPELLKKQ